MCPSRARGGQGGVPWLASSSGARCPARPGCAVRNGLRRRWYISSYESGSSSRTCGAVCHDASAGPGAQTLVAGIGENRDRGPVSRQPAAGTEIRFADRAAGRKGRDKFRQRAERRQTMVVTGEYGGRMLFSNPTRYESCARAVIRRLADDHCTRRVPHHLTMTDDKELDGRAAANLPRLSTIWATRRRRPLPRWIARRVLHCPATASACACAREG